MEKRTYDFSSLIGEAKMDVVICPASCVLAHTRVGLAVRVHALTLSEGQGLGIYVWNTLPCDEDPATEFIESSPLISAEIDFKVLAPSLVTPRTAYDPLAYLRVTLIAVQSNSPAPLRATLSACLLLRAG